MEVHCNLYDGFAAMRLVNFLKFDEFLPHSLYGQVLGKEMLQTKGL